jgi:S-(hydroxymethyl)glutathione dehydrogenase/alcohol dehydrogenase
MTAKNEPLEIIDLDQDAPSTNEIAVRLAATGLCHSDLSRLQRGSPFVPIVLGHEGAGVVEELGPGVTEFAEGDHVVLTAFPSCGTCWYCTHGQAFLCGLAGQYTGGMADGTARLHHNGKDVWQLGAMGAFAERMICPVYSAVKVPSDVPLKLVALLGCGVTTGFGAALNTADIKPGDSVAVLGCGGVGLNSIQGARICGANQIIAVDVFDSKLEMARTFGATSLINATESDVTESVKDLTEGRGVDHAFEVIGSPKTIQQAMDVTRPGGETVLVGMSEEPVTFVPRPFIHSNISLKGSRYGSSNFRQDVYKMIDLYRSGMLLLDELVSREINLQSVNVGFDAMQRGEVARSVIIF